MCVVCQMTSSFEPGRHPGQGPLSDVALSAVINEISDAAGNSSTNYSMSVGDSFRGTIGFANDEDWIAITLEAGTTYQIDSFGSTSGGGTLSDPLLRLYDSAGNQIAFNDDGGAGLESLITYTASTTGTYYISAEAYSTRTGSYTVQVSTQEPAQPGTVEDMALFLQEGTRGRSYTFDNSNSNVITVNLDGLTAGGQQLARWAMEAWEMVVDIDFVEVSFGEQLTVDDESSGAFAYFPGGSGRDGVEINVSRNWIDTYGTSIDSYSFQTYVHEFGHALGLNHQGNYNGSASYGTDSVFSNDSWQMSVMSYFSQTENTTTNASYALLATTMMVDIYAIQGLYGAPGASSATAGDTTYGLNSNLGNYMDEIFAGLASGARSANYNGRNMAFTIYDQGGTDTLDISYLDAREAANVNLNGGTFSDFGSLTGIMGIALGTVVENLVTGAGDDTVVGNAADNAITVNAGNDSVEGGAGNDSILGGNGNDTLHGGDQFDTIRGEDGDDVIYGGLGRDLIFSGIGNDRFIDSAQNDINGWDTVFGGEGNDTLLSLGGHDELHGNAGNDSLEGGNGNDLLFGGINFDTLRGGNGDDTLFGGDGRDMIFGGEGNDVFNDNDQGGVNGQDTVYAHGGSDTLNGGGGHDELHGNGGNDSIAGGNGNDVLYGGINFDTLRGGNGDDTLFGGDGRDMIFGGEGNDVFNDNDQGGVNGQDTVYGLGGNDTLNGGGGNDILEGNAGNDVLFGGEGDDRVFGGLDNDTMTGGLGADRFVFNGGTDIVTDYGNGADRLEIDDALWSDTLTGAEVVSRFASTQGGDVVFDFGSGNSLILSGVSSTNGLDADLDFI